MGNKNGKRKKRKRETKVGSVKWEKMGDKTGVKVENEKKRTEEKKWRPESVTKRQEKENKKAEMGKKTGKRKRRKIWKEMNAGKC